MIQQQFCNSHEDYMIQMVCLDYSRSMNYRMCKKCYQEFQLPSETNIQLQQEFFSIFNERPTLNVGKYFKSFKSQLIKILEKIPNLFNEIVVQLRQQPQNIRELKSYYNTIQMEIKTELNNFVYNQLDELEREFFSYDIIQNQELFTLPSNEEILAKMDGNNLLRKYEQIFIHQPKIFNEKELSDHINETVQQKQVLRSQSQQIRQNTEQLIQRIEDQIHKQKNTMIARILEKEQGVQKNYTRLTQFLDQLEKENTNFQIQDADFTQTVKLVQLNGQLEQLAQRQLIAQSRICHLGRIDFKIPLDEVQDQLCINYIPIRRQGDLVIMPKMEYEHHNPDPIELQGELFNFDLSRYFQTNIFRYTIIENQDEIIYQENSEPCKWMFVKKDDTYILHLILERGTMEIRNIRMDDGEVDFKNEVTMNYLNSTYVGQLNSELQYHGQGTLTQDNIIKSGQWQNGFQHGLGSMENRVNNSKYDGQFKGGLYHGEGELTHNNIIKSGSWENGLQHGEGKIERIVEKQRIFVYDGNFERGKFHGQGILHYRDDYIYEGNFVNGLREGNGTIKKNGQIIEIAEWKQDFPTSEKCAIF